jgi:hypothetical protein
MVLKTEEMIYMYAPHHAMHIAAFGNAPADAMNTAVYCTAGLGEAISIEKPTIAKTSRANRIPGIVGECQGFGVESSPNAHIPVNPKREYHSPHRTRKEKKKHTETPDHKSSSCAHSISGYPGCDR